MKGRSIAQDPILTIVRALFSLHFSNTKETPELLLSRYDICAIFILREIKIAKERRKELPRRRVSLFFSNVLQDWVREPKSYHDAGNFSD